MSKYDYADYVSSLANSYIENQNDTLLSELFSGQGIEKLKETAKILGVKLNITTK